MKAWSVSAPGGVDCLSAVEAETGEPGPTQIRIRVAAVGLSAADLRLINGFSGRPQEWPLIPGHEIAGTVLAVGEEASGVFPGDKVMAWMPQGGLAEETIVESGFCWVAPQTLSMAEIAAYSFSSVTAHMALVKRARVESGQVLVVHGATEAKGLAAVMIGNALGAVVVAIVSSAPGRELCEKLGADHCINGLEEDLVEALARLKLTPDVVFDPVGGDLYRESLHCAGREARIVSVGFSGGEVHELHGDELMNRNLDLIGFSLEGYFPDGDDQIRMSFSALAHMLADGKISVCPGHVYGWDDLPSALKKLEDPARLGKVVVEINPD